MPSYQRDPKAFDLRLFAGRFWPAWSDTVEKLQWQAYYRHWLAEYKPQVFGDRRRMHQWVLVANHSNPITFLEFGVAGGDSLARWAAMDKHPDSSFFGFDVFTGLPEASGPYSKGTFAQEKLPTFSDPRVTLIPGLFQDTLPGFLEGVRRILPIIVHIDCDLYSSTLYALTQLDRVLIPGSFILLDEASCAEEEFQALEDWARAYRRTYSVPAAFKSGRRVEGLAILVEG